MTEKTNEIEVFSTSQYIELITSKVKSVEKLPNNKPDYWFFRGQTNSNFNIMPSIGRNINKNSNLLQYENNMIVIAQMKSPEEFTNIKYPLNMLAKMQHYGLPTRLLDVSRNALVGLFFACNKDFNKDGKVFCFRSQDSVLHCYSAAANLISSTYKLYEKSNLVNAIRILKYEESFPRRFRDNNDNSMVKGLYICFQKPWFVLPELISERERRQQAAFILFPNALEIKGDTMDEYRILQRIQGIDEKNFDSTELIIKIPNKAKKIILDELRIIGISEDFLFPELATVCSSIKNDTAKRFEEIDDNIDMNSI